MTMNQPDDVEVRVVGRIAIDSRVRGRNHWTGERVEGTVARMTRSQLDGRVYVEVTGRFGGLAVIDDLSVERTRCRRPATIPDRRYTAGQPQGSGYRCANCGHTIWGIRDGRSPSGERWTHDAALAESPSHAF